MYILSVYWGKIINDFIIPVIKDIRYVYVITNWFVVAVDIVGMTEDFMRKFTFGLYKNMSDSIYF